MTAALHQTLPQTPRSLIAAFLAYFFSPVNPFGVGRCLLNCAKILRLFQTSATPEIEKVFGPQDQVHRMTTTLVKAVNEASYTGLGRFCLKQEMYLRADGRKAVMRYVIAHPEVQAVKIVAPLVIVGLFRSGTTLLQRLLACDPKARGIKNYEMAPAVGGNVVPPATEESWETHRNIARANRGLHKFKALFPTFMNDFNESHFIASNEFEEDATIMYHQQLDISAILNDPEVLAVQHSTEYMLQAYVYMKRYLQLLMAGFPKREHVLLKSPIHCNSLQALLSVFPDARIINLHRDVTKVVPSAALMLSRLESYRIDKTVDARGYGKSVLRRLATMARSVKDFRKVVDEGHVKLIPNVAVASELKHHVVKPEQFIDIQYDDLVADPIATVHRIYDHFGMKVDQEFDDAMKMYLIENPQGKHVKCKVNAKQMFGLTDKEILSVFEI
ncbi:P-loop containing nucleoside triphosphate hydrolase protein [Rhizoclosmatium globosum]|uniref:p-loop containing nucleoside triphosphate hydrolase protein n=1 Tax=Rhizoclosmatium globosum TaxID=329046 RepID=A0A1Y2AYM5_9FUNG|nr:P-loop containing nucleoside triphosphate hydrolase protein [Rhizoclosmatium globosum]|eukprot:ORY27574.1 P-loop containing nucleoside triphosphate hydrolase protein [Rhizoclosmatium globosum]